MRGVYRVTGTRATVTTGVTLCVLSTPAGRAIEILSARVSTDDAAATSEQMIVELNRGGTTPTGGTSGFTGKPTEEGSTTTVVTAYIGVTGGFVFDADVDAIARSSANKLAGWEYVPMPEERPIIAVSDFIGLKTDSTIASSSLSFEITYRELG